MKIELIETEELDGNWYKLIIDDRIARCYNHNEEGLKKAKHHYDMLAANGGNPIFEQKTLLTSEK